MSRYYTLEQTETRSNKIGAIKDPDVYFSYWFFWLDFYGSEFFSGIGSFGGITKVVRIFFRLSRAPYAIDTMHRYGRRIYFTTYNQNTER